MFKMRLTQSSLALVLGFIYVNGLPGNPPSMKSRKELLKMARNDFPKFKNIIEFKNPNNYDLTAKDFAKLGNELYKKENYDDALWHYHEAFGLNPLPLYITWQKLCRLGEKKSDKAIGLLRRAVSIDPGNTSVQTDLMDALWESGKFDDIVKSALLLLDHQNLQRLGNRFAKMNKFDEAIHCYNEGLNKCSRNEDLLLARAMCYLKMERVDEAVSGFTAVRNDSRTNFWTYHDFIDAMFSAGKFEEGLQGTRRLSEVYLERLAYTFFREKKFEYTILICDEALTRDVCPLSFYRWRGTCKVKLGDENEALEDFWGAYNSLQSTSDPRIQKLLERSPSSDERSEIVYDLISTLLSVGKSEEAVQEIGKLNEADFKYVVRSFFSSNEFENARIVCNRVTFMYFPSKELQDFLEYCKTRIKENETRTRKLNAPLMKKSDSIAI